MVNSPLIRPYLLGTGSFGGVSLGSHDSSVPMVFVVFNLGILGDEKTHKYPRVIGLIYIYTYIYIYIGGEFLLTHDGSMGLVYLLTVHLNLP